MANFKIVYVVFFSLFLQLSEVEQRLSQLEALVGAKDTTVVREGGREREREGGRKGGRGRERKIF